jgi:hypothetical protein
MVVSVHAQQRFDADVSGDVIAAQQAIIGEAGKGKIAGSVTEPPRKADAQLHIEWVCSSP